MNKTFIEYLASNFHQDQVCVCEDGSIEASLTFGGNEDNRIGVFYAKDMLSLSVFYGSFADIHTRGVIAFVDTYNEREDRAYELRCMNNQLWVEIDVCGADDEKAIATIEKVLEVFAEDGEIATTLTKLKTSPKARWAMASKRAQCLRERACKLDNEGNHAAAMELLIEICEKYYGYKHLELIALYYQHDFEKTYPPMRFPYSKEYALECLLLAMKHNTDDMFLPMIAQRIARELGDEELAKRMEERAQRLGTLEYFVFKSDCDTVKTLTKIANFYRGGFGVAKSERIARYYDRLAAGERETVFKDMLVDGFERVFLLMSDTAYYPIYSLSELDGVSSEFVSRYLYGDEEEDFTLPDWFVPLVNGLNEQDRDIVLSKVADRMQGKMERLLSRAQAGEVDIVIPADKHLGVTIETVERWRYVYAPDLTMLAECEAKERLLRIFDKFKNLR